MSEYKILTNELDERSDGVHLIDSGDGWKETALRVNEGVSDSDKGWVITSWETTTVCGEKYWIDTSAYFIKDELVDELVTLRHEL